MRYFHFVILALFGLTACSTNGEQYYLATDYTLVDDKVEAEKINGEFIPGSDLYDGMLITVCDSLCIYYSGKNPIGFFSVLNMETGQELGSYCIRGRGPRESTGMGPIAEIRKESGEMKADIIDAHNSRLFVWNITQSLVEKRTIYDTIRPIQQYSRNDNPYYSTCLQINDSLYFIQASGTSFEEINQIVVPRLAVISLPDKKLIQDYPIFTDSIVKVANKQNWMLSNFFGMEYCIKPDKNKIAMGMSSYPQINILDLKSGDLQCLRLKNHPAVSTSKRVWYYASICCDDGSIYGLYNACNTSDSSFKDAVSTIHVFDWNGNLKRKLSLEQLFDQIYLDGKKLYTFDSRTGKVFRYAL